MSKSVFSIYCSQIDVPEIGGSKAVFPKMVSQKRCFQNRCSVSSLKRCPEIRCSRIWCSQKRRSRFLGTILLHTLGCYQPMAASRTMSEKWLNSFSRRSFIKPRHLDAFRATFASSPRLSSWHSREANANRRASRLEAD